MIGYSEVPSRHPVKPAAIAMPAASFWRELMNAIPIVLFVRGARSALRSLREKKPSR